MPPQILSPQLHHQFEATQDLLRAGLALAHDCADPAAAATLQDRLANLQSAALFVIVGEVKSGKSSFVNALLQDDICQVAPDPCTATIQELVYGEHPATAELGANWHRVHLPKEVLKEITIVDTPGTNSIIRDHQTITEQYIPQSDIVVFVFPATNPYTATAWDFLSLIRQDWYRKTVFVLQQADRASADELATNRAGVERLARERQVPDPTIFPVSAKRESEGAPDSGMAEFRQFLRQAVETGDVWRTKLTSSRDTVRKIAGDLHARLAAERAAIIDDTHFYQGLLETTTSRRQKAAGFRRLAVASLSECYNRLAQKLEREFTAGLAVGTVLRRAIPVLRDKNVRQWLADLQSGFETTARQEIDAECARVSKDISAELETMFHQLTESLRTRPNPAPGPAPVIASDRADILDRLQRKLHDLRIADIVGGHGLQGADIGKLTLAGGGLAAFGAALALTTQLMAFDITGGILALAGASLVAVTLLWKRAGIIADFRRQLTHSRDEFRERLDQEIAGIFDRLFLEVEHSLREPMERLQAADARLAPLTQEAERLLQEANARTP